MLPANAKQIADEVRMSTIMLIADRKRSQSLPLTVLYTTTPSMADCQYDPALLWWDIRFVRYIPSEKNQRLTYSLRGQIYSIDDSIVLRLTQYYYSDIGMDITDSDEWFFDVRDPNFAEKVLDHVVSVMYRDTIYQIIRHNLMALYDVIVSGRTHFRRLLRKWRII